MVLWTYMILPCQYCIFEIEVYWWFLDQIFMANRSEERVELGRSQTENYLWVTAHAIVVFMEIDCLTIPFWLKLGEVQCCWFSQMSLHQFWYFLEVGLVSSWLHKKVHQHPLVIHHTRIPWLWQVSKYSKCTESHCLNSYLIFGTYCQLNKVVSMNINCWKLSRWKNGTIQVQLQCLNSPKNFYFILCSILQCKRGFIAAFLPSRIIFNDSPKTLKYWLCFRFLIKSTN